MTTANIAEIVLVISCILIPFQIILFMGRLKQDTRRQAKDDLFIIEGLINGLKRGNYQSSYQQDYNQDYHTFNPGGYASWNGDSEVSGFKPAELAANSATKNTEKKLKKRVRILTSILIGLGLFMALCLFTILTF